MKQGKNPTRTQKEIIARKTIAGKQLNPCNWLVINDTGASLTLENKASGKLTKLYYGDPIAQR